jgi:cytochrome b
MERMVRIKVWDGWVRLFHWSIVVLMVVCYVTARAGSMGWHMLSGYAVLALVLFRIAWGFVGSDTARFTTFLRSPAAAFRHLLHLRRREPDTEAGHNAAGGWMVLVLIGLLLAQAVTGLFADDDILTQGPLAQFASERWVQRLTGLHDRIFNVILIAVALHVLAVVLYRVLKGHKLARAMVTGVKDMPAAVAPAAPRMGSGVLAAVLLLAAAAAVYGIARLGAIYF